MKHFLDLFPISSDEIRGLLAEAARLKAAHARRIPTRTLSGRVIGLVFEKPSLRTRVSFEAGIAQLGGSSLFLPGNEVGLGWRETVPDFARVMSRYVDCMVLRVFRQQTVDGIASAGSVPVINGLSDRSHPCQALADLLTVQETTGEIKGRKIVFVGDGNNVAMSLAVGCEKLGASFALACPPGYEFDDDFRTQFASEFPGRAFPETTHDPVAAVKTADVIYTDVWTSMGQESEREERLFRFAPYQVNSKLVAHAPASCRIMHCLPAHRGEEITDEVVDGGQCVVFDQAENRMHVQKAVLEKLLG